MKLEIPDKYFNEEELENTPKRFQKFLDEWFDSNSFTFTVFKNPGYNQMIIWKGNGHSLCSHHLLPIKFNISIGYIPNKIICGLSKIQRVVNNFAHKPQLQERLTQQIGEYLKEKLLPKGIMIVINGEHSCVSMRGVKQNGTMITSYINGEFEKNEVRSEFLSLCGGQNV